MYLPSSTIIRVAIAWVAPSARAIGPTISSPEAETTTTSRPHSLWAAMRSAASANTSGVTMSCRVSLTIDRTWATSQPAHMLVRWVRIRSIWSWSAPDSRKMNCA
ncbi:Uncharacterised protein [Mycobacterium tuberculosis]|uniref:Secreted protein n=1 Tax=Mycobacterium tuberculosis TaxID=1773 RepID=A0A0U0U5F5_MYCTX|nr:Uncharacterised protein [Mycobacterium tuberculosis]CFS37925.1 Uncharacterised protein [Mycobacterium tuberculosis]CKR97907.1 Uncharacterised protein [Mycobacterium tuberculosis]CKS48313.1 Uncharacterised protein [Mycobacterium tuberculosis]CKT95949.1 Uncharacterised protein [Mycobacterium tuberculosis]